MNLHNRNLLRELVLNVGSLTEILGLYIAYCLGQDKLIMGLSLLLLCVVVNNLTSRGWLKLIKE